MAMFNKKNKTFIVAEIGNNHEGNIDLAKEMIALASHAGADAVKFQTFIPELYVTSQMNDRLKMLKSFQLTQEEFIELSEFALSKNLTFFSTPFDLNSAIFLNKIQSIFKISSADNTFFPLIDTITDFRKTTIISSGLADFKEIDLLYERILEKWDTLNVDAKLCLLHCVSSYPVPPEEANLNSIREMIKRYPRAIIGYSDHTIGNEACISAVSLGARIIEKHFTIRNDYSDFRDHQLSANPEDFEKLVVSIRKTEKFLENKVSVSPTCEEPLRDQVRRSIAVNSDKKKGEKITMDDICWVRPGTGIPPGNEVEIIGKILNKSKCRGELIYKSDLK